MGMWGNHAQKSGGLSLTEKALKSKNEGIGYEKTRIIKV